MSDSLPNVVTPYMKHLEVMALSAVCGRMHALESIRSFWGGMINANASTFFEAFNENDTLSDVCEFYDRRFGRSLCKYFLKYAPFDICNFRASPSALC